MYKYLVILISGKRYSGKDQVAKILKDTCFKNNKTKIKPFAYYAKRDYAKINNLDLNRLLYDRYYKEKYRPGIIKLAMDQRNNDPDVWVKSLYGDILINTLTLETKPLDKSSEYKEVVFIPDHRFHNEYLYLKKFDHIIVKRMRIITDDLTRSQRGWKYNINIDDNISENSIKDPKLDEYTDNNLVENKWDYIIYNNHNDLDKLKRNLINNIQICPSGT